MKNDERYLQVSINIFTNNLSDDNMDKLLEKIRANIKLNKNVKSFLETKLSLTIDDEVVIVGEVLFKPDFLIIKQSGSNNIQSNNFVGF